MTSYYLLFTLLTAGQDPAPKPVEEAKPAASPNAPGPDAPAAVAGPLQGSTDLGYRTLFGQHGSQAAYRSVVNLQEGPRVLGFPTNIEPPGGRYFDHMRLSGANWGDPFTQMRLGVDKAGAYRANIDFRSWAYFNALPSYANPALPATNAQNADRFGLDQRSYDTRNRLLSGDVDFRPGRRWTPFLGFSLNSGQGAGVTPIVLDENNYAAAVGNDFRYWDFRGGVRYNTEALHLTLEQGGAVFRDDQSLRVDGRNLGNRTGTFLGSTLRLDQGAQGYGIRGNNIYSSAAATYSPAAWIDISGQVLYSKPYNDIALNESASGNLFSLEAFRFLTGQTALYSGFTNRPRTSALGSVEVRPLERLRILYSFDTDQMQTTGGLLALTTLNTAAQPRNVRDTTLRWSEHESRVMAFYDLTPKITVHGGHKYTWGEARVLRSALMPGPEYEEGSMNRNAFVGGFFFRPSSKLSINTDAEVSQSDRVYFRTTVRDFEQFRMRGRYQISSQWSVQARFQRLDGRNPAPGIKLAHEASLASASVQWLGKSMSLVGDYTRSEILNDINFFVPQSLATANSRYRDNAHTATAFADFRIPRLKLSATAGGSIFLSSGSRPTRYYQPLARLLFPIAPRVQFLGEWRHYSMGQNFYSFEAFGVQQITFGLRIAN